MSEENGQKKGHENPRNPHHSENPKQPGKPVERDPDRNPPGVGKEKKYG
ncbi:hypothetical protein ACOI1C_14145 [Bacillus sp. DJP31]